MKAWRLPFSFFLILGWLGAVALAQDKNIPSRPAAPLVNDAYDTLSARNIVQWFSNNGSLSHDPAIDASGLVWTRHGAKPERMRGLMFTEGAVFTGLIGDSIYLGGATYRSGLQAGPILANGKAADPADPVHRIYKARSISKPVFDALPAGERARLRRDFVEWPWTLGAPWMDSNQNGVYDADFDRWLADSTSSDKPLFIGDEMQWFVSNDLDSTRSMALYGTLPLHVEVRTLLWSVDAPGSFANTVFCKQTYINRNDSAISGMHFGRWADPDLGDASDDFVGIDSARDMMYVYNAYAHDGVYNDPPALAVMLLQGPIVQKLGGIARWNFSQRAGWGNLRMTASNFILKSNRPYDDASLGLRSGAVHLRNQLLGLRSDGSANIDPVSGMPTAICLAGDPVTKTGWTDGMLLGGWPGDRRMMMAAGPVTMASGDTQEVVWAEFVGDGATIAGDILALRDIADELRAWYSIRPLPSDLPASSFASDFPETDKTRITIHARVPVAVQATGLLYKKDGTLFFSVPLFDDGAHDDGAAGDGNFAARVSLPSRYPFGVRCVLAAVYPHGLRAEWPANPCLPLSGPVRASLRSIESDHLNFDHSANAGENLRLSVDLANGTPYALGGIAVEDNRSYPDIPSAILFPDLIPAFTTTQRSYDAMNSASYLVFDVPGTAGAGQTLPLPVRVTDTANQCWCDTLGIAVRGFTEQPFDSLTIHIAGRAGGTLGWRLSSRSAIKDHTYQISVQGDARTTARTLAITDLTDKTLLASGIPFPDALAHESPLIDGWKVTRGTAATGVVLTPGASADTAGSIPSEPVRIESAPPIGSYMTHNVPFEYAAQSFGTKLQWDEYRPVKLVFSHTRTQKAYRYLRGGTPNYGYQGFFDVPLRAYDITDSAAPRQLELAFLEQNGGERNDSTWDPRSPADREYLFVFSSTYTPTPDPALTSSILNADAEKLKLLYTGWYFLIDTMRIPEGTIITLMPQVPTTYRDTFLLNPMQELPPLPYAGGFHLGQVYPNPVQLRSGGGSIVIPLGVQQSAAYTIALYDMLGRREAVIFDGALETGLHTIVFAPPPRLSSGVYRLLVTGGGSEASASVVVVK